ncbi:hypothetical protein TSOC_011102 [Tetrabaena socialis]|uniref:Uncharacterized protein n=1 Tax=Tetrabaena socialis TaxID=47790 RepID=A0A2J7ZRI9_9CHLO|nr:hypothetical protein TSOC_011102 [Tetrabaena socialis]|eukprot:PNH02887.1 hypothetical protein TSOC_011102 [Tetrabaena socialis]
MADQVSSAPRGGPRAEAAPVATRINKRRQPESATESATCCSGHGGNGDAVHCIPGTCLDASKPRRLDAAAPMAPPRSPFDDLMGLMLSTSSDCGADVPADLASGPSSCDASDRYLSVAQLCGAFGGVDSPAAGSAHLHHQRPRHRSCESGYAAPAPKAASEVLADLHEGAPLGSMLAAALLPPSGGGPAPARHHGSSSCAGAPSDSWGCFTELRGEALYDGEVDLYGGPGGGFFFGAGAGDTDGVAGACPVGCFNAAQSQMAQPQQQQPQQPGASARPAAAARPRVTARTALMGAGPSSGAAEAAGRSAIRSSIPSSIVSVSYFFGDPLKGAGCALLLNALASPAGNNALASSVGASGGGGACEVGEPQDDAAGAVPQAQARVGGGRASGGGATPRQRTGSRLGRVLRGCFSIPVVAGEEASR